MGTKKGVGIANILLPLGGKDHFDFALFTLAATIREGMRDVKKRIVAVFPAIIVPAGSSYLLLLVGVQTPWQPTG